MGSIKATRHRSLKYENLSKRVTEITDVSIERQG